MYVRPYLPLGRSLNGSEIWASITFISRMRSASLQENISLSRTNHLTHPLRFVSQARNSPCQRSKYTVNQAASSSSDRVASSRQQTPPTSSAESQFYAFITGFPFPLGPLFQRKTCRYEVWTNFRLPCIPCMQRRVMYVGWCMHVFFFLQVVKDTIWTFEQTQALENFCVYTPVRMTVIRLKTGGLWVHAPVAPTDECVSMLKELGDVEYIILPTFAYEHKAFVGPFSRKFPKAKVILTLGLGLFNHPLYDWCVIHVPPSPLQYQTGLYKPLPMVLSTKFAESILRHIFIWRPGQRRQKCSLGGWDWAKTVTPAINR